MARLLGKQRSPAGNPQTLNGRAGPMKGQGGSVMGKMSYREKFIQMNKEAKATWVVAAIIIAFWWITSFGLAGLDYDTHNIFHMPVWFVVSCFGVWILSIILVTALATKVFKNFSLEDEDDE